MNLSRQLMHNQSGCAHAGQCILVMCIFAGAWEWEYLEEAIAEKLKNPLAVAQLMDRIRSFVGREKVFMSPAGDATSRTELFVVCRALRFC